LARDHAHVSGRRHLCAAAHALAAAPARNALKLAVEEGRLTSHRLLRVGHSAFTRFSLSPNKFCPRRRRSDAPLLNLFQKLRRTDWMQEQQARYAIYFVAAPESDLHRFGSAVLGYDCYTGDALAFPDEVAKHHDAWHSLTEEPRRYGFHATLK